MPEPSNRANNGRWLQVLLGAMTTFAIALGAWALKSVVDLREAQASLAATAQERHETILLRDQEIMDRLKTIEAELRELNRRLAAP